MNVESASYLALKAAIMDESKVAIDHLITVTTVPQASYEMF